jgi:pimeloyl-ACP methyl ester carboxylesterase
MAEESLLVEGRARSADGVEIAHIRRGTGPTALLLIHGGLANHSFWRPQMEALAGSFQVIALDLAGHGVSGAGRRSWTIPAFAADVTAVAEALDLRRVVLVGNSLGGAVALEAARLLRERAIGVVGVDTLHDLSQTIDHAWARSRAEAFRDDYAGTCHAMVEALFHPGAYSELRAWAEKEMCVVPVAVVAGMMEGFGGFDLAAAARAADVPLRAINGDLWPTATEGNRAIAPGFDAVIMTDAGHYPMLERPDEFNRNLTAVVAGIERTVPATPARCPPPPRHTGMPAGRARVGIADRSPARSLEGDRSRAHRPAPR